MMPDTDIPAIIRLARERDEARAQVEHLERRLAVLEFLVRPPSIWQDDVLELTEFLKAVRAVPRPESYNDSVYVCHAPPPPDPIGCLGTSSVDALPMVKMFDIRCEKKLFRAKGQEDEPRWQTTVTLVL